MIQYDWYNQEIFTRYGTIKRARGSYLYTEKGVRLVDLYQEAGRAILGWGNCSGRSMLMLKNTLDRGITGSFITDYEHKLKKAVLTVLPKYTHVRVYASKEQLVVALAKYKGISLSLQSLETISLEDWLYDTGIVQWRPWLDSTDEKKLCADVMHVPPPVSWAGTCFICVFTDKNKDAILASNPCPSPLLAAATRGFYDFQKEFPKRTETDWCIFDKVVDKYFTRKGPYLFPKVSHDRYKEFVIYCIEKGVLLSPNYVLPSIVPYSANIGDFKKLKMQPFVTL